MPEQVADSRGNEGPPRTDFAALMDAAVDAIVVIEADGEIVAFNRAAERMFGVAADEMIGRPVDLLMPEPYRSEHAGYIERYLKTGDAHVIGIGREIKGIRKSGQEFPVLLSVGESISDSGRHFVGIIRDLSEQRQAELDRRALEVKLAHVSRLSLLGEMAAGIAHEINQPLTAITNYSQAASNLVDRGVLDQETLREACIGIADQVQRAGEVIRNLRQFIRAREIRKEPLGIQALIDSTMVLIHADTAHEGIEVDTEFADELPDISGNAVQLQQVLLNLTRNAVDAMRESVARPKEIRLEARRAGDMVELRVMDRGPGVSPNLEDAIFHPFFTTKPDGLGVGLAISRSIVESHGGELGYEHRSGGGSTFYVKLPILSDS
jgi:two-component system sensor kinase FixL